MNGNNSTKSQSDFSREVGKKASRKLKEQRKEKRSIWSGFGMFGIIGWSVAVPTVLGAVLGRWLDVHHPGKHVYTLALLLGGLVIGCFNAWYWVSKEMRDMEDKDDDPQLNRNA